MIQFICILESQVVQCSMGSVYTLNLCVISNICNHNNMAIIPNTIQLCLHTCFTICTHEACYTFTFISIEFVITGSSICTRRRVTFTDFYKDFQTVYSCRNINGRKNSLGITALWSMCKGEKVFYIYMRIDKHL